MQATCGSTRSQACRSISLGIPKAQKGYLILVGTGCYGDINDDLQYTSPGDETADLGLGCVICVDKQVTIESTDGADATIIDPDSFEAPLGATRPTGYTLDGALRCAQGASWKGRARIYDIWTNGSESKC